MGAVFAPNTPLLVTVFATTVAWIAATLMTRPENEATLVSFYRLVRPAGRGWAPIAAKALRPPFMDGAGPEGRDSIPLQLLGWVLGCTFVYCTLFGAGTVLYGQTGQAIVFGVAWLVSGFGLIRILKILWKS
jgi:hypothetical protein